MQPRKWFISQCPHHTVPVAYSQQHPHQLPVPSLRSQDLYSPTLFSLSNHCCHCQPCGRWPFFISLIIIAIFFPMHYAKGFTWIVTFHPRVLGTIIVIVILQMRKLKNGVMYILKDHMQNWALNSGGQMLKPLALGSRLNCWKLQCQFWEIPPFYFTRQSLVKDSHSLPFSWVQRIIK